MATSGMVGGLLIASIGHVGRGDIAMHPLLFLATLFTIGIASAGLFVPYRTVLQRETPVNLLGRVTAVGEAAIAIAMLAGPPLGAVLANVAGIDCFAIPTWRLSHSAAGPRARLRTMPHRLRDGKTYRIVVKARIQPCCVAKCVEIIVCHVRSYPKLKHHARRDRGCTLICLSISAVWGRPK
jgi:MFS family permease